MLEPSFYRYIEGQWTFTHKAIQYGWKICGFGISNIKILNHMNFFGSWKEK